MYDFEEYLEINKLSIKDFYSIMSNLLINEIFDKLFYLLEQNNNKLELKKLLLQCNNNNCRLAIITEFIQRKLQIKLTKHQERYLSDIIYAYMTKSPVRKKTKIDMIEYQQSKCLICGKNMNDYKELDHKVPFKFVGDELKNNIDLLCRHCNRKKSDNYYFVLKKFLLK